MVHLKHVTHISETSGHHISETRDTLFEIKQVVIAHLKHVTDGIKTSAHHTPQTRDTLFK